jgi:hypothetical protein
MDAKRSRPDVSMPVMLRFANLLTEGLMLSLGRKRRKRWRKWCKRLAKTSGGDAADDAQALALALGLFEVSRDVRKRLRKQRG